MTWRDFIEKVKQFPAIKVTITPPFVVFETKLPAGEADILDREHTSEFVEDLDDLMRPSDITRILKIVHINEMLFLGHE